MKWKTQCSLALLAALLVSISDLASAQRERQRERSPIRSVPVAADVKRDPEFSCPEEFGYYAHPSDCSQYYVCVFGGALLESCTGGLMYSNELQTCDWPRNVGCTAVGGESERVPAPTPPPPPRTPPPQRVRVQAQPPVRVPVQAPPPPPRPSPNPVVTSRGQPTHYNHQEIVKQQLYAEVDEQLPPAEELESDRQQRVLRGQPSSIGQVARDRDGQGRVTSNTIPSGKIGAFSFGTQVEQQQVQNYSESPQDLTDDREYPTVENELTYSQKSFINLLRRRRETPTEDKQTESTPTAESDTAERDKRQIRFGRVQQGINLSPNNGLRWNDEYTSVTYSAPQHSSGRTPFKPSAQIDNTFSTYVGSSSAINSQKLSPTNNYNNQYNVGSFKPYVPEGNKYVSSSPIYESQSPTTPKYSHYNFKTQNSNNPYLPITTSSPVYKEEFQYFPVRPGDTASLSITKSPPISSLTSPNDGPFTALSGGFYNNQPDSKIHHSTKQKYPSQQNFGNHQPVIQESIQYNYEIDSQKPGDHRTTAFPVKPLRYESIRSQNSGNNAKPSTATRASVTRNKNLKRPRGKLQDNRHSSTYRVSSNKGNVRTNQRWPKPDQHHDSTHDHPKNTKEQEEHNNDNKSEDQDETEDETEQENEGKSEEEEENEENEDSEKGDSEDKRENENQDDQSPEIRPQFPKPPDYFKNLENKYDNVVNPFADPEFDFDTFISKIRSTHLSLVPQKQVEKLNNKIHDENHRHVESTSLPTPTVAQKVFIKNHHNYLGMSTPRPFSATSKNTPPWPTNSNNKQPNQPFRPSNQKPVYEDDSDEYYEDDYEQPEPVKNQVKPQISQYQFKPIKQPQPGTINNHSPVYRPAPQTHGYRDANRKPYTNYTNLNHQAPTYQSYQQSDYRKPNTNHNTQYHSSNVSPKPKFHSSFNNNPVSSIPQTQTHVRNEYKSPQSDNRYNTQTYRDTPVSNPIISTHLRPASNSHNTAPINQNNYRATITTEKSPGKRRPIPKPSPEMNDYYYDDEDDDYDYEPPVKSKFMPSTEVKPQRPPIAQNYEEYEDYDYLRKPYKGKPVKQTENNDTTGNDSDEDDDDDDDEDDNDSDDDDDKKYTSHNENEEQQLKRPVTQNTRFNKVNSNIAVNSRPHNRPSAYHSSSVSPSQKAPTAKPANFESYNAHSTTKLSPPVSTSSLTPTNQHIIKRPEISNYEVLHGTPNHVPKVSSTLSKPRYVNQTTLRPYTVRSRLAKPSSTVPTSNDISHEPTKETFVKHPTRGSHKISTTTTTHDGRTFRRPTSPSTTLKTDSDNQETRSHTDHDDNAPNRVEPTVSSSPSYTQQTRGQQGGRALYNGSLQYDPQQFDPYYALYDEDAELYKDADYAQQYNSAAQRPGVAVQQTYRGTPPPRAPAATPSPTPLYTPTQAYSSQPSADDYDDALINAQISDQNQYQQPIRPSTTSALDDRNELGYELSTRGLVRISSTPPRTTSTTTTTTTTTTPPPPPPPPVTRAPLQRSTTSESLKGNLNPPTERSKLLDMTTPLRFSSRFRAVEDTQLALDSPQTDTLLPHRQADSRNIPIVGNSTPDLPPTDSKTPNITDTPVVMVNKSRFLSLSTGFSFQKDNANTDDNDSYTLRVFKSPAKIAIPDSEDSPKLTSETNDTVSRASPQRVSYKIEDIVVVDDKNDYNFEQKPLVPKDFILENISSTERPPPISFVINNLPEPGQKPIVIQLKARTGSRAHGPRITSDQIVPIYNRPVNRVIDTQPEKTLTYVNSIPKNRERPFDENKSKSEIEISQNLPNVYLRTVIKRPASENSFVQQESADSQEADTILSFLRQPSKSRLINVGSNFKENMTLDNNKWNNNIDTLPNSLSRRKVFRDIFNAKTESSVSNQPNVSPFKTLENLRRDIVESKTVPATKNYNSNPIIPVVNTTQSSKVKFHNLENSGSFHAIETTPSPYTETSDVFNSRSNERSINRPTTTTDIPTVRRKPISRRNYFSNPIAQNILENIRYISSIRNEPVVEKGQISEDRIERRPSIEVPETPVSENVYKFFKKPNASKKSQKISSSEESLDSPAALEELPLKSSNNRNDYEGDIETSTEYTIHDISNRNNRRKSKYTTTSEKIPIFVETTEHSEALEDERALNLRKNSKTDNNDNSNSPRNFASAVFDVPASAIPLDTNNFEPNKIKQYQVTTPRKDVIRKSSTSESTQMVGGFLQNSDDSTDSKHTALDQLFNDETAEITDNLRHTTETDSSSHVMTTSTEIPPRTPLGTTSSPATTLPTTTPSTTTPFPTTTPSPTTATPPTAMPSSTFPTTVTTHRPTPPGRPLRVNPAIKAKTSMTASRRSYSPSKCTENNLQNPKCNDIKLQRTNTRGRGTSHYSSANGAEQNTVNSNRGTPPPRVRPTLKPSTSIVSKATEFVDIYRYPPRRPDTVYPTPQVDKTAAKCRKDVCLLPDCWCGGKDIPGNLPVGEVPQMVLITFDDAVNDLNKVTYADLFEQGRKNPNGCPIAGTFYVSHEWTDYSQVQNLYADGHEMASHTVSHSFGEQFSQKKWNREISGQREILAAYGGVKLEDVRGMRAPFLSVGGNKMFKMLYDSNFTYDSSMPVYENRPPSWPYTLDYKLFHDCMIPPCPTKSYPGVWEVPMVMWQDLNGGRCSMGDACSNPPEADGVYKMLMKNFERHYLTNRAPFGLFYHAAWFTQAHHKKGFIMFLDAINAMKDVFLVTNWQALQWVRDPTPLSRINSFQPFHCDYQDRPKRCNNPKVCNLWHKSGVRYMRTCQPCPEIYPWTGKTGIRSSRIDNEVDD